MSRLNFSVDKIETTDNKQDSIDNLQDTQSYSSLKGLQDLFKYIYPVNSIYISYSHAYPGDLFGGTWERIESKFLWCGDEYATIGGTGGETTHTLSESEMPSHSHMGHMYAENQGSLTVPPGVVRIPAGTGFLFSTSETPNASVGMLGLTNITGNSQPHNNMPPYIQVSAWRRTAL